MSIHKVYYVPYYLTDETCCAYIGEDYNFYEGNAFDYSRYKIRGCVAGQDYEYIQKFPYMADYEDFKYPFCAGYILENKQIEGEFEVYRVDKTKDGTYYERVGWLSPRQTTDSRGIWRRGYDIYVWKPEYAGWAWVGFTDGIPAVGAAYVLLMREDEISWGRRELYYEGMRWKAGERKPSEAPEIGTRFRWRDDRF